MSDSPADPRWLINPDALTTDADLHHFALLSLGDGTALKVALNGGGYTYVSEEVIKQQDGFVFFQTDPRLLLWLLKGPGHAQWGNAEIGSHIQYLRRPNIYERGLYYVLASFHA